MTINSVRVILPKRTPTSHRSPIAHVHMEIDNGIPLRGMTLRKKKDGSYMLVMPAIQLENNSMLYFYHPVNQEVRDQMTEAVVAAYEEMLEKSLHDHTKTFDEGGVADFTSVTVRRFDRYRELKGSASVVLDEALVMNRIAILIDEATGALRMGMPYREFSRFGSRQAYFRFPSEDYMRLYHLVMANYTGVDAAESEK